MTTNYLVSKNKHKDFFWSINVVNDGEIKTYSIFYLKDSFKKEFRLSIRACDTESGAKCKEFLHNIQHWFAGTSGLFDREFQDDVVTMILSDSQLDPRRTV
jgi:hypothetical protein